MNFANHRTSQRLQLLLQALFLGEMTTLQLRNFTNGLAISTSIGELERSLGIKIKRRRVGKIWYYSLPEGQLDLNL